MSETTTPAPGSQAARDAGCRCPIIDNGYGKGIYGGAIREPDGSPAFWYVDDCPVHVAPTEGM